MITEDLLHQLNRLRDLSYAMLDPKLLSHTAAERQFLKIYQQIGAEHGELALPPFAREIFTRSGFIRVNSDPQMVRQTIDELFRQHVDTLIQAASEQQQPLPRYLHPALHARCTASFVSGDYATALLVAFRYIEVRVRELAQLPSTDIGVGLVSKAMSSKNVRIVFSDVEAEQEGYHSTFRGALAILKNPLSHKEVEHLDRGRTLERLAFASMLLKDLDEAEVRIPEPEPT